MSEPVDSIQWKIDDRKFHAERAKRYDADQKASGEIFKKYHDIPFIDKLNKKNIKPVLDFGCGTGVFTIELAKRNVPTIAFDHSRDMVEIAKRKVEMENPDLSHFIIADCEFLPFRDSAFGGVICNEVLHHLPNSEKAIQEMVRVTRSGGLMYFAEPERKVPFLTKLLNNIGASIWVVRGASLSPTVSIETRERPISGDTINLYLRSLGIKTSLRYSAVFPSFPFFGSNIRYHLAQLISPIRIFGRGSIFFIEGEK